MSVSNFRLLTILFFLFLSPTACQAASIAVITASKDTTIYQSASNNLSGGGAAGIFTGTTGAGINRRGLIDFDIASSIPAGSTITGVQLRMYLGNAPNSSSVAVGLHKLSKDWGEGTAGSSNLSISGSGMGFTAAPGDATWADAKMGSVPWSNLGGTGDFNAVASSSTAVSGPIDTPLIWNSTSQLINDVQNWLDSPASNFGWAIVNANEGSDNSVKAFYSRSATQNSTNVANSLDFFWRPTLTVTFIPEPLTIVQVLFTLVLAFAVRSR